MRDDEIEDEEEDEYGWLGYECPICHGHGEIDDEHYTRRCSACAGTGEAFGRQT